MGNDKRKETETDRVGWTDTNAEVHLPKHSLGGDFISCSLFLLCLSASLSRASLTSEISQMFNSYLVPLSVWVQNAQLLRQPQPILKSHVHIHTCEVVLCAGVYVVW